MFKPNKRLGQNFLKNTQAIRTMVKSLNAQEGEEVIEIGPGLGSVTTQIMEAYGNKNIEVKALEIDLRFIPKLEGMFADYNNFAIVETNVLDWLPHYKTDKPFRIIGSLPYYITSPILHKIIKMKKLPESCVLLIQKEVAEKIAGIAPDSSYMSVIVQTFFEVEYVLKIDRSDFSPEPKVDGGVLKLTKRSHTDSIDIRKYEGFVHKAFSNPRKMLNKMFYEDELNRAGIDPKMRAQNYNWEDWLRFFKILA